MADVYATCMVLLLGYPGFGKRTVGTSLARLLDCVLVDNALISVPLLTLFKWDGKFDLPPEIWERVKPIRAAVLGTIEAANWCVGRCTEGCMGGPSRLERFRVTLIATIQKPAGREHALRRGAGTGEFPVQDPDGGYDGHGRGFHHRSTVRAHVLARCDQLVKLDEDVSHISADSVLRN